MPSRRSARRCGGGADVVEAAPAQAPGGQAIDPAALGARTQRAQLRRALRLRRRWRQISMKRRHSIVQRSPGVLRGYWLVGTCTLIVVRTMRFCSLMCAAG
jgi:hypothetical protein